MKLITHNILMCNKNGCTTNNFPLRVIATKVEIYNEDSAMEYTKPLMQRLLDKIDYPALYNTVNELKWEDVQPLPEPKEGGVIDPAWAEDESFL